MWWLFALFVRAMLTLPKLSAALLPALGVGNGLTAILLHEVLGVGERKAVPVSFGLSCSCCCPWLSSTHRLKRQARNLINLIT